MTTTEKPGDSVMTSTRIGSPRFPGYGPERDIADAIQGATGCYPRNAESAADDVVKLLAALGIEL